MSPALRQCSVLVVEDDQSARAAMEQLLALEGYQVRGAGDGVEALAALDVARPDLLLTDLDMPRMDGLALLETVHARFPELPVLLLTAHGEVSDAVRAMRAGPEDYLLKPVGAEQLLLALRRTLERCRRRRDVPIPGSSMATIQRHAIVATLDAVGGSTTRAARMLELSVRTVQYRLHEYGLAAHRPHARSAR